MIKQNTTTIQYLNGKVVDVKTLQAAHPTRIAHSRTEEHIYYETILTEAEIEQRREEKRVEAQNAHKFFENRREMREDQEKFH